MNETYFLKLGGSLITDKDQAQTALLPQIDLIANQISHFIQAFPEVRLLIGHGSGSFGHVAADRSHTREGVKTKEQWQGFTDVWAAARALNQIFLEGLEKCGLPVIGFPPSASVVARNGIPVDWNIRPIQAALDHHLLPVVYGDVVFDEAIGGTILSTEELFAGLVPGLKPNHIFLAGLEAGVWQDFPACTKLIPEITPCTYSAIAKNIFKSASVDVTGGMASKVSSMLALVQENPDLQVTIFSGKGDNSIFETLSGHPAGTVLKSDS